jgi:uncharacterized DUF497 family protein
MGPISRKPIVVWDEHKRSQNVARHGIDLAEVELFDWQTALIGRTYSGARGQPRYKAVGLLAGRLVGFIFSPLGSEAISAISLRPASRKERRDYENR